jgi:hypothetical protein
LLIKVEFAGVGVWDAAERSGWSRPDVDLIGYDGTPDRAVIDKLSALIEIRPVSLRISDSFALADAPQAPRALMNYWSE